MEKKVFLKLNGSSSQALPPSFFEVAVVCYVVDEQKAKSLAFIYLEKKLPPALPTRPLQQLLLPPSHQLSSHNELEHGKKCPFWNVV